MVTFAGKYVTNGGHHERAGARIPHSPLEATLTRTFNPQYASYMGDGGGRDSYIITSNGGLTSHEKPHMMRRTLKNPKDNSLSPLKPSKPINYRSDGTGRDSYVIQNSGGLVSDYRGVPVEQNFKSSLRFNPQSPLKVSSDKPWGSEITDFLNWRTPKENPV